LTFKEILELIEKVAEHGIGAIEIERAGTRIRIEGKSFAPQVVHHSSASEARPDPSLPATAPGIAPLPASSAPKPAPAEDADAGLHIITSPIVGTFYRSPNPESDSFVNVGDRITKGKVLCIVEAMKLMNEIESEVEGVLVSIYPQNGQPIEYGEKLFAVRI
jgi:acetyl-CoA carboxylase biotin carboxyl carrier protein